MNTKPKAEKKEKCRNCGKLANKGFYLACSKECASISSKKEMNIISKMMQKLPKVKLHL